MRVIDDEVWLCVDCTVYAANGDLTGCESDARAVAVQDGVDALGPHLVSNSQDDDREFSTCRCEGCGSRSGGSRTRFAILGEEQAS